MNRAGGVFYHLRALHSARAGWRPFREAVGHWLEGELAAPSLVLVGPSAGYCLEDALFRRFERITVLEPDGVARWLLERRARRLGVRPIHFVSEDRLVAPLVSGKPSLESILNAEPGAAVLFSNVLGQIRFLLDEAGFEKWQQGWTDRIVPLLRERPWASFHDRVSGEVAPRLGALRRETGRLSDEALTRAFYSGGSGELLDHLTGGLFPEAMPHRYFHWEIEPGVHHLVEGVAGRGVNAEDAGALR